MSDACANTQALKWWKGLKLLTLKACLRVYPPEVFGEVGDVSPRAGTACVHPREEFGEFGEVSSPYGVENGADQTDTTHLNHVIGSWREQRD